MAMLKDSTRTFYTNFEFKRGVVGWFVQFKLAYPETHYYHGDGVSTWPFESHFDALDRSSLEERISAERQHAHSEVLDILLEALAAWPEKD